MHLPLILRRAPALHDAVSRRSLPSTFSFLTFPTRPSLVEDLCHVVARWTPKICRDRAREGKHDGSDKLTWWKLAKLMDHHAIWEWWWRCLYMRVGRRALGIE